MVIAKVTELAFGPSVSCRFLLSAAPVSAYRLRYSPVSASPSCPPRRFRASPGWSHQFCRCPGFQASASPGSALPSCPRRPSVGLALIPGFRASSVSASPRLAGLRASAPRRCPAAQILCVALLFLRRFVSQAVEAGVGEASLGGRCAGEGGHVRTGVQAVADAARSDPAGRTAAHPGRRGAEVKDGLARVASATASRLPNRGWSAAPPPGRLRRRQAAAPKWSSANSPGSRSVMASSAKAAGASATPIVELAQRTPSRSTSPPNP